MPITQAMPTSFKVDILNGYQNFGTAPVRATGVADTFKIALYTSSATLDATTATYTTSNEIPNGSGYTTGGITLSVSVAPTSTGTTAYLSFASPVTWTSATFSTAGALIYNSTQGNRAVAVLSFGSTITVTGGDFNIIFPTAAAGTAILQIA
jgi:hypothetical protein